MKPLFNIEKLNSCSSLEKLALECEECFKIFYLDAKQIKSVIKRKINGCRFCSLTCANRSANNSKNKIINVNCAQCNLRLIRAPYQQKQSKSGRSFCSQSCAATYNNTHKTTGTRRSKLEKWLEEQLTSLYPTLECRYNFKDEINSELDIYIPPLNLAFELNGIFHYEPIYGDEKLASIQNNDNRKFQACLEKKIELVIIDASGLKYFKPANAQKYFNIISHIINKKCQEKDLNL
jgi:hypothetical protein